MNANKGLTAQTGRGEKTPKSSKAHRACQQRARNREIAARETPLERMDQLRPAPYNPRAITDEAAAGLTESLSRFGDLSGIVWNSRTGHLVAGHQRLASLRRKHGEGLRLEDGAIVTPDGSRFAVRVVDWDQATEKAANVTANNPHIAGTFTPELQGILVELQAADSAELLAPLRLDSLLEPAPKMETEAGNAAGGGGETPKFMIVVTCESEDHQVALLERFMGEGLECRALTS